MSDEKNPEQQQVIEKFHELFTSFDDAMLVTLGTEGQPHARPMRIVARHEDDLDDLWFVSSLNSGKIDEIRQEPKVAVTMTDNGRYLSISGNARVVRDRAKIESMWKDTWKVWFPDGPASEDIALIQVHPRRAEYWDRSFPNGLRFAYEAAKAWVKDEPIDVPDDPEQHGKVRFVGG